MSFWSSSQPKRHDHAFRGPSEPSMDGRGGDKLREAVQTTLITLVVAVVLYGLIFGFAFAIGLVLLILVHELGHVLMLHRLGYRIATPIFIPFLGAIITMKEPPKTAQAEALIAYGGPLVGAMGAYGVYLYYLFTGDLLALKLAFLGFLINLFNLIPLSPLDGGRIAAAISRWLWLPGVILLVVLFVMVWNPIILLVIAIGVYRAYQTILQARDPTQNGYFTIAPSVRLLISFAYFGLILFLGYLTMVSYHQVVDRMGPL